MPQIQPQQQQHFYPRSPRGERQRTGQAVKRPDDISIHAPREGSDKPPPKLP